MGTLEVRLAPAALSWLVREATARVVANGFDTTRLVRTARTR
jgi:hypothetical protein